MAGGARIRGEAGQATIETVAMVPLLLFLVALALQMALAGLTFVFAGNAADVGARTLAVEGLAAAAAAADDALPGAWADGAAYVVQEAARRDPPLPGRARRARAAARGRRPAHHQQHQRRHGRVVVRRRAVRGGDGGQATIELVGVVPVLLFVALLVVQVGVVGAVLVTTESAARAGARAQGQTCNGVQVAEQAPPGWLQDESTAQLTGGPADTVTVEVRTAVPVLFTGLALPAPVTRRATFPRTGDC